VTFTQCRMKRGNTQTTAWIPSEFAKAGKWLRIGKRDGWQVVSCGGTLPAEYVLEHERNYRTQRQASDI